MTLTDITAWVARVAELIEKHDDDASAHAEQDEMREAVLAHIAAGGPDAKELAAAALASKRIKFTRWHS